MASLLSHLITAIIVIAIVVAIFLASYVKAPPDTVYIISGLKKTPKTLIGKAGFKIPFLERLDKMIARQITIDIKTGGYVPTYDFIGVDIDAVAKVRLKTDPDGIQFAMKNFLNMKEKDVIMALTDSLQGNMREIVGTISLRELCNDRKKFGDQIQEKAQVDMSNLGVEIISCNIQRIADEKDLINALGQDNMSKIQKDAQIAKAEADRDVAIATAQAKKASNEMEVESETAIAQRNTELLIKQAELKKQADIKQAEADAAYKIQEQEQRKALEVSTINADIAKAERDVELKEKEANVKEQELTASIKKKADADMYARERQAEAELYAAQKEAEAIKIKGEAEADAIKAKAIAEAEGIEKKAEAQAKMRDASILEMYFNVLPAIAENVAKPLSSVDKITMYGEGNSTKLISDIVNSTTQVSEGLAKGLGVDVKSLLVGALGQKAITDIKKAAEEQKTVTPIVTTTTEDTNTDEESSEDTVVENDPAEKPDSFDL